MTENNELIDGWIHECQQMFDEIIDKVLNESLGSDFKRLRPSLQKMFDYVLGNRDLYAFARILLSTYSVLSGCGDGGAGGGDEHNQGSNNQPIDRRVYALVCAMAMVIIYVDMLDDIMDGSDTRLGKPCWHTLPTVGMSALNDSTIVLSTTYKILKLYFSDHQNYVQIVHCIQESIEKTAYGQLLDMQSTRSQTNNVDLNTYTLDNYRQINKAKNGDFATGAFLLGMYASGQSSYANLDKIDETLTALAILEGVTNDLDDLLTDGTDISEGKCSWLYVRAIQLADNRQKSLLLANYGLPDPGAVQLIRQLYGELNIKTETEEFIKTEIRLLKQKSLDISSTTDNTVLNQLLNKFIAIYKKYFEYLNI
ncbi:uncharacterized protein LOC128965108 [Oppia nitens]|uniref:uncharacterized protein LOC128965108 n=1 Tax=Oppia nitens TaxID=1686743 RepID=UPI0023DC6394|nr:uncharacterized protein LOC128965108 [Oppia nitens]XP_054167736.1 uncharacterized protein LOC128965108 [Oppia nitens]